MRLVFGVIVLLWWVAGRIFEVVFVNQISDEGLVWNPFFWDGGYFFSSFYGFADFAKLYLLPLIAALWIVVEISKRKALKRNA